MKEKFVYIILVFFFCSSTLLLSSEIVYQAHIDVVYAIRDKNGEDHIDYDAVSSRRLYYATAAKEFLTRVMFIEQEIEFKKLLHTLSNDDGELYYFPGEWYGDFLPKPYYTIGTFDQWKELLQDLEDARIIRIAPGVFLHDHNFIGTGDSSSWNETVHIGMQQANTIFPENERLWQDGPLGRYQKTGRLRLGRLGDSQVGGDIEAFSSLEGEEGILAVIERN